MGFALCFSLTFCVRLLKYVKPKSCQFELGDPSDGNGYFCYAITKNHYKSNK